jgi:hypothetical protein
VQLNITNEHVYLTNVYIILTGTDKAKMDRQSAFVIDDEEEDEEGDVSPHDTATASPGGDDKPRPPSSMRDPSSNSFNATVQRPHTDYDRQQALVLHKLAGLQKGASIEISRDFLPGALLFPCHKYKHFRASSAAGAAGAMDVSKLLDAPDSDSLDEAGHGASGSEVIMEVHRYLVVTKERFMVLDADGGGVGSPATVKSNHHLTEVTSN